LAHLVFQAVHPDLSLFIDPQGKSEACAQEFPVLFRPISHALPSYPIATVPAATTCPTGRSAGSLQVFAGSPLRAAGFPLIRTVALPMRIVARFVGGRTKDPPAGMWGGRLVAVLLTVAPGIPMTLTFELNAPSSSPA
jgi:hypothetical protein